LYAGCIAPRHCRSGDFSNKAFQYIFSHLLPYISLKDKSYFYMAGIWQPWTYKVAGEYVETFSIVTTKANKLMELPYCQTNGALRCLQTLQGLQLIVSPHPYLPC
jgi:hypothetical protein